MHSFVLQRYGPILMLLLVLRLVYWLAAFPNPDEAYYWVWGQHLDWSYFDHPPFHAWIQGMFAQVGGRSRFMLRLPTLLSTGCLLWLYWLICWQIHERQVRHAFWLTVLLVFTSPLFFLFTAMAWNDHWLIVFGVAASYCLVRFLSSDRLHSYGWLYGAGLFMGLAGLCKYLALFLGLGFWSAIASHGSWRSLFRNGHLYGASAIALILVVPVFWWNLNHEFYSFQFYLGRSVQAEGAAVNWFGPITFGLFSVVILGPFHSWIAAKTYFQGSPNHFGKTYQRVAWVIFATSTFLLTILALKAPVLYYWNILAYPLLFPLMAGVFLNFHQLAQLRSRRLLHGALSFGAIAAVLLVFHYTVVPWSALISATGDDDTRMLYGWQSLATQVSQAAAKVAATPLFLTTDYRSASALAYVLGDVPVWSISGRIDQFDFWYKPADLHQRDGILLGDRWHPICPAHLAMFDRTEPPQTLTVRRFGVLIKDYTLVQGYGFHAHDDTADPFSTTYPLAFTSDGESCSPKRSP